MLGLPQSTEFNKRIPKQKFYENLTVSPVIKKAFAEQIKIIYWRNKIAMSTVNLSSGQQVTEIEVIEIRLNEPELDENVLWQIDREIPYHIRFLLAYEDKYRAVIGYKEAVTAGKTAFKVEQYYYSEWLKEQELPVHLEGLTLDAVYEKFVRQIAGEKLNDERSTTLKESVEKQKQREQLKKQIAMLETRMRKKKQINRKMELKAELKKIKKILTSV